MSTLNYVLRVAARARRLVAPAAAAVLLGVTISSCGGTLSPTEPNSPTRIVGLGPLVLSTRQVAGISGVELATLGSLTITQGGSESLVVEAQANLLPPASPSTLETAAA